MNCAKKGEGKKMRNFEHHSTAENEKKIVSKHSQTMQVCTIFSLSRRESPKKCIFHFLHTNEDQHNFNQCCDADLLIFDKYKFRKLNEGSRNSTKLIICNALTQLSFHSARSSDGGARSTRSKNAITLWGLLV